MTQLTIRRLDQTVIDGLKKRAAAAGHSMEEEARNILREAIITADNRFVTAARLAGLVPSRIISLSEAV
jgi:antitoxin FitA